ncbi:MAG: 50S ribosomal protein L24 [Sphaerochaetaceae bacterium]|nr:50S ribosomal protein L24 [Spirochaetales bacterium]MDY3769071.1 50S ribosomal protein L24 [Sphaerochaetaceae bacterium]
MYIKKNDTVKVLSGREKGKTGKVIAVNRKNDTVIVSDVNMVSKALRRKNEQDKGGIIRVEAPLHVSNVALMAKDGKPTRVGFRIENGKKVRYSKRTNEVL